MNLGSTMSSAERAYKIIDLEREAPFYTKEEEK